eukprot:TRINITY_DN65194_c0_g1_i1.p1 TRINITY_DN65194_c0_g1~~TRINITY_DN65194_c0_g1_i1.p1  ORF type:complete len:201 (+),score=61.82 TRINITY_DN65194_c0_g1_i1:53-655(+)
MLTGTVKSYNPHKGWGFVECNGQDSFLYKKELKGVCPTKGDQVQFSIAQSEKGTTATDVKVIKPQEEQFYFGEIKSFNPSKGFGFIACEAMEQDVFVLKSELPGGFGPQGGHCKFKVAIDTKGPSAKSVTLLGAAGNQAQQMSKGGFKGAWGGGKGSYDMSWGMGGKGYGMPWPGMDMPWGGWDGGKGYGGKGFGKFGGW